ncbi:DUF2848 domain-containing protein [Pelagibius litoralis]|uniref:DUF2848 domain-containing protein n=1 Tax=Pelagibius litoralis TaxID=374515 RepID=A0A967KGU2_9PROT|nr:DUF2848 domain-containing protein [Pelagibius litoralis]NIA70621.1 DUF2848 domain-containing protein [Pelagibius litoralis]
MRFSCGNDLLDIDVNHCIVAGWTGRDPAAIQHHVDELAQIGVAPPSAVPLYYRVSSSLLTQASVIEVVGPGTSGEVEPLLIQQQGALYLGLASDHTDRDLEAHSVALSKQACAKPAATALWRFEGVAGHLDDIMLNSWIREGDGDAWVPYQSGSLGAIRPLADLIEGSGITAAASDSAAAMLCGTLGVSSGGVRSASAFRMELKDPVLDRSITHAYDIVTLPIIA